MSLPDETVKVAVVGTGLAGLTAAYLLSQTEVAASCKLEVHLFEKEPCLGMDSSSVTLQIPKAEWRIDVPMRSFQGGYYPRLISLYRHLGVKFRQADFSYSFSLLAPSTSAEGRRLVTTTLYNGASGRAGLGMPSMLHQPFIETQGQTWLMRAFARTAAFAAFFTVTIQILLSYIRLLWLAFPATRSSSLERMSFRQWAEISAPKSYLARLFKMDAVWRDFVFSILLPLFSAICTAPSEDIMDHPVEEILDYVWLTFGTHHYVVDQGIQDVATRLTACLSPLNIHLSSCLSAVRQSTTSPSQLTIECGTTVYHGFDHILLATQANRAVPILTSYLSCLPSESGQRETLKAQMRCLRTFRYRSTIVINHTDATLLPECPHDRRDLNLVRFPSWSSDGEMDPDAGKSLTMPFLPPSYTMTTQILPRPASLEGRCFPQIYQTTNPIVPMRKETVLSIARLERAVLTLESKEALRRLPSADVSQGWWPWLNGAGTAGATAAAGPLRGAGKEGPGVWFCGSYAHSGIPLLEGCVVSARNAVKGLLESEGLQATGPGWSW